LIDQFELKTGVITFTGDNSGRQMILIADYDLTLRQVAITMGWITTDPTKTAPPIYSRSDDFYLNSATAKLWTNLAFPMPKGTALYWNPTSSIGSQLCSFTWT
jgi:hypothetical protein